MEVLPQCLDGTDWQTRGWSNVRCAKGMSAQSEAEETAGCPSIASGSVTEGVAAGRGGNSDSQQQMSDSRSGFEDEWERMEGRSGKDAGQSLQSHPKQRKPRPRRRQGRQRIAEHE